MNNVLKKAGLGVALAATALTVSAPADAQRYRHYYRHDSTGPAIVAGVAGLAIGAALASNNGGRDRYYRDYGYQPGYDDYYYRDHGYYPNDGYYNYYYRHNGYRGCYMQRQIDPYWHRSYNVRVCR
ncbi:MAG: hypothetical protein ABIS14_15520 [Sphingomonas sp.]